MNKILSICICVYNKFGFTKSCLNDLLKLPNNHEIIIVDNGSTDETQSLKNSKEIIYHRNDSNYGFGKASNIAYLLSSATNVLFLNNDIRVRNDYSNWTKLLIEKCNDFIVGPTMGQLDDNFNFIKEANQLLSGKSYMSGWCIASSKENWNKLNIPRKKELLVNNVNVPQIFSDEEFFCYFEDTDLSFRAKKLGIKFEVVDIPVVHFGRQTSKQLNTYQLYKTSHDVFIKKWNN
jgi:GT2 family glycosyltransferase